MRGRSYGFARPNALRPCRSWEEIALAVGERGLARGRGVMALDAWGPAGAYPDPAFALCETEVVRGYGFA